MVQFSDAAGGQAAEPGAVRAPAAYVQPHIASLEQVSHTPLGQQSAPASSFFLGHTSPLSSATTTPQFGPGSSSSEVSYDTFSAPGHLAASSSDSCVEPAAGGFVGPVAVSCCQSGHFSAFGSVDNMPTTRLDAGLLVTSEGLSDLQKVSGSDVPSTDVSRAFEVVPVAEADGQCFSEMGSTKENGRHATVDNNLQKDTRVYSVDSLNESKGYSSDSSSDVYMNSDYTDTVTSADSGAFLLGATKYTDDDVANTDNAQSRTQVPFSVEEESLPAATTYYSNEAFSDNSKELNSWSPDGSEQKKIERVHEDKPDQMVSWVITVPEEEDSGMLADKEDDEDDVEDKEMVPLRQEDSALESLVQQLADQHPGEMVDITVQVLNGPVYESLTEPLEEESWLQSTESLHLYKLLKQGRSNTTNSLRVNAINNLRANTMNNLHERSSFLNLTAASVSSLGRACQKALTYVRADMEFGSMMSLRGSVKPHSSTLTLGGSGRPPSADTEALSSEFSKKGEPSVASGRHARNVLYMALIVTLLLVASNATRNLQSSLNQEGGVGITGLAVMFVSYTLGSLLSPVAVQGVGVKACITGGLVLQLLYVAANLYPVMWVMVPASLGAGASLALIWNAMSTYVVLLARGEADFKQKAYERVSDKYFGIFCLVYQSNLVIGNLISSLVLSFADGAEGSAASVSLPVNGTGLNATAVANFSAPYFTAAAADSLLPVQELVTDSLGMAVGGSDGGVTNSTAIPLPGAFDATTDSHYHLCGAEYCHHFVVNQESSAVSDRTIYLLFGIFMLLVVVSMVMAVFLLEPLSPRPFSSSSSSSASSSGAWHNVKRQIVAVVKFSRNAKFLLLLPMLLYSVMQFTFVCSEVMMVSTSFSTSFFCWLFNA